MPRRDPDKPVRRKSVAKTAVAPAQATAALPYKACLIVTYGAELGKRVAVGKATFEIGRSSKNELPLDQEAVSRQHARIIFDRDRGHVLSDLGSTNGSFVNGVRVKEALLADGDQIRIGRTMLKFMAGENVEAHYHEEIYRLMTVDGLTRAFNKRYFREALDRECNRARRYARDLSVVLFEIDDFRNVGDAHGQVAGDSILQQLVAALQPRLRREDVVARIGGEEFAVLLPEVGLAGARVTAEKIRNVVATTELAHEAAEVMCTVSLGIAALDPSTPEATALLAAAGAALERAKTNGKNRVEE